METNIQIIIGATELFKRYGIKSISMDDIARHLSISKKTIYQHFEDKDKLVLEVLAKELNNDKNEILCISTKSKDVIEELMLCGDYMRTHIVNLNPALLFDLKKYHPEAWKYFEDFKKIFIVEMLLKCLQRGIDEKYFRNDINAPILARLRAEEIELGFNTEIYPTDTYNTGEVQMEFFSHFIYGVSTLKGHERLDELLKYKI